MSVPIVQRPYLLNTTIVPDTKDLQTFLQYLTRLYEDIAFAVNNRDFIHFTMAISGTPETIINLPLFGSFIICVSGQNPGLPCITIAINKPDIYQDGEPSELAERDGNITPWVGSALKVVNSAPASTGEITMQIYHNNVDPTLQGNFNIRIIGTQ